jgi:hypothetical protein
MMIENRDWMGPEDEMAGAARIAICARRIGYPDMESVVMRVMATRSVGDSRVSRDDLMRFGTQAAFELALLDPESARTVFEQVAARSELDPTKQWSVREQWLIAWALVDIKKAEALFEAGLTALDGAKEVDLWNAGLVEMAEFLAPAPQRREEMLGERSHGGFWWPVYKR